MMMQVADILGGRHITATHVIRESVRDATHFWGLRGGHTLVLREQGRRFVSAEEQPLPIGIAVSRFQH